MRLISIGSVPPKHGGNTRGGVATLHSTITQEFINNPELGIEVVSVIAPNSDNSHDPITGLPYIQRAPNESRTDCLKRAISSFNPDCIFVHHITHSWAAALKGIPNLPLCVGYVHSLNAINPQHDPNHQSKRKLMNQATPHFDLLIFNTPHSHSRAIEMDVEIPCPVEVLPPPVARSFINHDIVDGPRECRGIFIGRLDNNKNILNVLTSFSDLSSKIEFDVVGSGPLKSEIDDIAEFQTTTNFHAELDSNRISELLSNASFLCVPSHYESFGLVYVESLCMGVPIIGFGPSVEFIEDLMDLPCGIGLTDPTPENIAAAIDDLLGKDWNYSLISSRARTVFNPSRYAQQLSEILNRY